MKISPLNLISTPIPILNSLGLKVKVGLSSEDPMVWRHPSRAYQAYLSVYSPDGRLVERRALGVIPPYRRRFFDLSELTQASPTIQDHLVVAHRVPEGLIGQRVPRPSARWSSLRRTLYTLQSVIPEDPMDLPDRLDYSFFRSYIQYAFEGTSGGNGSVIYEAPHRFNETRTAHRSSGTLTFTTKVWLSPTVNTYLALMNYSTDPTYDRAVAYHYGVYADSGVLAASGQVTVRPFTVNLLDMQATIPIEAVRQGRDPQDGAAVFSFIGYCEDAALAILILNLDRTHGGISVEHTHPAQSYLMPAEFADQGHVKMRAIEAWKAVWAPVGASSTHER